MSLNDVLHLGHCDFELTFRAVLRANRELGVLLDCGLEVSDTVNACLRCGVAENDCLSAFGKTLEHVLSADESGSEVVRRYDASNVILIVDSRVNVDDWDSGFSFKNNVLDLTILQLKITDCKVFQPKESINTSDNPVVAFYFDLKNIDFEGDLKLARAFVEFFVPTQGDDVLELAVLSLSDDIFINSVTDSVGIGEIKSGAVAFELKDANTPVVLEAYNYETGKSYGTQTFNTKSN